MEQKTRIHAEEGKQELVITRVFDLPVELVYRAYSEIELIEEWMGTSVKKLDHKNLGSYHFETSHNGQVMFKAHGSIHEVIPNEKIVRTFEMENSKIGVQLEFLEFEKLTDDSSRLSIQIIYRSEQHRAEQLKLPFAFGLNIAHDRLNELRTNKTNAQ